MFSNDKTNNQNESKSDVIILLYHRITEIDNDLWSLCVSPQNFKDHLSILKAHYNVISLTELIEQCNLGKISEKSVVITFDDGYRDNILNAKPIMDQFRVPFTVFLTTGNIENDEEFWWDALEKAVFSDNSKSGFLALDINDEHYEWNFDSHGDRDNRSHLRNIYYELWGLLQPLDSESRNIILKEILEWSGQNMKARSSHATFDTEDIHNLAKSNLVEVGAHTVSHPKLSALSRDEQLYEIKESKNYLENLLGRSVDYFSYPFGGTNDFDSVAMDVVKKNGFQCSCSNINGAVNQTTDIYNLPRMYVEDVDENEFDNQLDSLLKSS